MSTTAVAAPTLSSILRPMTLGEFGHVYWGRKPLHLTGRPERYAGLIDEAELWAAVRTGRPRLGRLVPADPALPLTAGYTEEIGSDDIEASLAAGRTVCITDLSAGSERLAAVVDEMVGSLGVMATARFNAFWSPPGSGAEVHIDARVTTSLQLSGRKQWWFAAEPALAWPRSNAQILPDGEPVWMYPWCGSQSWEELTPPRELSQVVLEPGDFLCLPAGTWHAAKALDLSLALNLSFSPPDLPGLVRDLLAGSLSDRPRWRGASPPTSPGAVTDGPDGEVALDLSDRLIEAADLLRAEAAALRRGDTCETRRLWRHRSRRR